VLIALRLAIAFALLLPAAIAGIFDHPTSAVLALVLAAAVSEATARYVGHQRVRGHSTTVSELVMVLVAIVMGLVGAWQVAGSLP